MKCKLTSSTQPTTTRKANAFIVKNAITSRCRNPEQMTLALKLFPKISVGLGPTSLKRLYQITNTWSARSAQIKRKSFFAWNYNRSRLEDPHLTHKPRHKTENPILKSSLDMIICAPEHGSLILERLFLTTIKMHRAHLTHVKWQYTLIIRMPKCVAYRERH